jgi:hypothetical protein
LALLALLPLVQPLLLEPGLPEPLLELLHKIVGLVLQLGLDF